MFGTTKEKTLPVPVVLSRENVESSMSQEYFELAQAIGLAEAPAVLNGKLTQLFHEEHIQIFNLDTVEKYLDQKFPGRAWTWQPLREADSPSDWHLLSGESTSQKLLLSKTGHWNGQVWSGYFGSRIYSKPVPFAVLATVKKIADKLPLVHFFVSDESPREFNDPFLAVVARGINNPFLVIERWDEPSFRG